MLIEVLFTVVKTRKLHKCPSTDEWIKKKFLLYIYYLATKKNEITQFAATWMNLEIIILSEVRQTNITGYHLKVKSKNNANEYIYKTD